MAAPSPNLWSPPSSETYISLQRQQKYLESHLQALLDAQSAGLLALTGDVSASREHESQSQPQDVGAALPVPGDEGIEPSLDTMSISSQRLPHTLSSRKRGEEKSFTLPIRQPKPRRITLRASRRGIGKTIADLAVLKETELHLLEDEARSYEDSLSTIREHVAKEEGLKAEIARIEAPMASPSSPSSRTSQLERSHGESQHMPVDVMKEEENRLGNEIKEAETRLYQLRAEQRLLRQRIQESNNRTQAELSSWRNALELAERDGKMLVAREPKGFRGALSRERGGKGQSVWSLPAGRRTLRMVEEQYIGDITRLSKEVSGVEREQEALERGGEVWAEVLREMNNVEMALSAEMKVLNGRAPNGKSDDEDRTKGTALVLDKIASAIKPIEEKLELAQKRSWTLLICAIGAELEALRQGLKILEDVHEQQRPRGSNGTLDHSPPGDSTARKDKPALSKEISHQESDTDEQDEVPGPELLVSHHGYS